MRPRSGRETCCTLPLPPLPLHSPPPLIALVVYLLVPVGYILTSVTPVEMGCLGGKTEEERLDEKAKREANKKIERQLQKERQTYKATHRLLLLGEIPVCLSPVCLTFQFLTSVSDLSAHVSLTCPSYLFVSPVCL